MKIKNPNLCLRSIKKLQAYRLIVESKPRSGVYQVIPELKQINIDSVIKKGTSQSVKNVRITPPRKKHNLDAIKKDMRTYLQDNFRKIPHPFNEAIVEKIELGQLSLAIDTLFGYVEKPVDDKRVEDVTSRFYEACSDYFSKSRTDKAEMTAAYGSLVHLFQPVLRKIACLKNQDTKMLGASLGNELFQAVYPPFNSDIYKKDENYWRSKDVTSATFRYIFPYRHMESHEASSYYGFEMERIVYYFFASLILICRLPASHH